MTSDGVAQTTRVQSQLLWVRKLRRVHWAALPLEAPVPAPEVLAESAPDGMFPFRVPAKATLPASRAPRKPYTMVPSSTWQTADGCQDTSDLLPSDAAQGWSGTSAATPQQGQGRAPQDLPTFKLRLGC